MALQRASHWNQAKQNLYRGSDRSRKPKECEEKMKVADIGEPYHNFCLVGRLTQLDQVRSG